MHLLRLGDTDLISIANRRRCEDVYEVARLLLVSAGLLISYGIFSNIPKDDGNTFACLAIGESKLSVPVVAGAVE